MSSYNRLVVSNLKTVFNRLFYDLQTQIFHPTGHSVGELGCAYADGCFTAEEMILSAYSRGLASIETKLIKGSMAAVGLGYNQVIITQRDNLNQFKIVRPQSNFTLPTLKLKDKTC